MGRKPDRWRTINGKRIPIYNSKGKAATAAVVTGVVAALGYGGGSGLLSGGALEGAAADALPGNLSGEVADSLPGRNLSVRKTEGTRSARRGRTKETFGRFRLKELERRVEHDLDCAVNSTERVRKFFLRKGCTSLHRALFAVGDGQGNAAMISVVWVGFRKRSDANAFERIESVQGSGDVKPLGAAVLGLGELGFSGHHYHSRPHGRSRTVVETETATGQVPAAKLDALAEVCSWLPRL
ncbi:hypothetical protein [Sciscionella marina]|uniref:hypothetical protein n=1 Tax=Sciscionella marina TaxID=508770 RepID=UPI000373A3D1|nr:hypothetical protein [Sciscionella marina]